MKKIVQVVLMIIVRNVILVFLIQSKKNVLNLKLKLEIVMNICNPIQFNV